MRQRAGRGRRVEDSIVNAVELKLKKQQVGRSRGDFFLGVAVEFGTSRVGRIAGIDEAGKGNDPAEQILDLLVALHGLEQAFAAGLAGEVRELALVGRRKGLAHAAAPGEVLRIGRRLHRRIEVGEVPFGQIPEVRRGAALRGSGCRDRWSTE